MANFKASRAISENFDWHQRRRFFKDVNHYVWGDPHLFKIGADNLMRRSFAKDEAKKIIWKCHNSSYGEYFNGEKTVAKILR